MDQVRSRTAERSHRFAGARLTEAENGWFNDSLPSADRLLFVNEAIVIGRFDCRADDELFADSGEIRNAVVVFPRSVVGIRHEGRKEFISTPNQVNFYNRGQRYRRRSLGEEARDVCDWFAIAPVLWRSIMGREPSIVADGQPLFERPFADLEDSVFVRERALVARLARMSQEMDELAVLEHSITLIGDVIRHGMLRLCDRFPNPRRAADHVEEAKSLMAADLSEPMPLLRIAREAGLSVYHLCKIFRSTTGTTMHSYRTRLRLRYALDRVLGSDDLLSAAIAAGFSSHSHFTSLCRRYFGYTPSAIRGIAASDSATPRRTASSSDVAETPPGRIRHSIGHCRS